MANSRTTPVLATSEDTRLIQDSLMRAHCDLRIEIARARADIIIATERVKRELYGMTFAVLAAMIVTFFVLLTTFAR